MLSYSVYWLVIWIIAVTIATLTTSRNLDHLNLHSLVKGLVNRLQQKKNLNKKKKKRKGKNFVAKIWKHITSSLRIAFYAYLGSLEPISRLTPVGKKRKSKPMNMLMQIIIPQVSIAGNSFIQRKQTNK